MSDLASTLAASGPLAAALTAAVIALWRKLEAMERKVDAQNERMFALMDKLATEASKNDRDPPSSAGGRT